MAEVIPSVKETLAVFCFFLKKKVLLNLAFILSPF